MERKQEKGFVLITSLVILLLLTILSVGLYSRGSVNQKTSASTRDATKAYYYAETALNYVSWSLFKDPDNPNATVAAYDNDAELDSYNPGTGTGDRTELLADLDAPATQLKYFDNTNLIDYDITLFPPYNNVGNVPPTLSTLALPGHLALDISDAGVVTIDVDANNDGTNDWAAEPTNGAVVWLTAADPSAPGVDTSVATGNEDYLLVAYSIGMVNGNRRRMLRAIIGEITASGPAGLGSITNAAD